MVVKFRARAWHQLAVLQTFKCLHNIQPKVKTRPRPWSPDHHCSRVDTCGDCLQRLCSAWCPRHSGIRSLVPTPSHSRFLNFPHHLHWHPHSPSRSLPLCQLPSGFCMFYLTSNTHLSFSFLLLIVSLPVSFSLPVFLFLCLLIMKQALKAPSSHRKQSLSWFERSPPKMRQNCGCPDALPTVSKGFWEDLPRSCGHLECCPTLCK